MPQFVCWVVFPVVLGLVSLGCGLLVQWIAGRPLPDGLLLPVGLALTIVVAEITTKWSATAPATTPLVVALAVAGVLLSRPWRERPQIGGWSLGVAGAVYLVYLAPVLLSGEPTFAGYIKLDDTATWMAMTDRVLSHGHDLSGLAPSTYETTLHYYLTGGEPVGAMLPWGVGHQLVGQDLAWVFQPYLAFGGAMLASPAWALVGPVVRSRALRAAVVFVAAQAALIYGYSLWGGIKEVTAAWLLACSVASMITVVEGAARIRSFVPLAATTFAMLGVYGFGGAVWLVGTLAIAAAIALRTWMRRSSRVRLVALAAVMALLAFGLVRGAQQFVNANASLTGTDLGNLVTPLRGLQLLGIWPASDFRVNPPNRSTLTHLLIYVAIAAAGIGVAIAIKRRRWVPLLYLASAMIGVLLTYWKGSPWVLAKALAVASPAALLVGLAGLAALVEPAARSLSLGQGSRPRWLTAARRTIAVAGGVVICGGVLWSNVLAYHHVTLAPYGQLSELQRIGGRFAGEGPTLINEYQPYAARHFLRAMDPESPSELRRRVIPLRSGGQVPKGGFADLDEFQTSALLVYRTIVTRTSPVASRPPSPYRLVYSGRWYQVWQRPRSGWRPILDDLPLGNSVDPTAVPQCSTVLRLAHEVGPGGLLAASAKPAPLVTGVPSPLPQRTTDVPTTTRRPGIYEVWLGGSFVRRLKVSVDGRLVGSAREILNEAGQWTPLGTARMAAGRHAISLSYGDAELAPGSGGPGAAGPVFPVGPLAVAPADTIPTVRYLSPAAARSLCRHPWDWIEVLGAPGM